MEINNIKKPKKETVEKKPAPDELPVKDKETKKTKKKKFFSSARGTIIYIAVVIALVFLMPKFLSLVLRTDYPIAAITSGSMWPALKKGDLVLIKGIDPDKISAGDIIVYRNKMENGLNFTIHRVTDVNQDEIITKGDANRYIDAPITKDLVVGVTVKLFGWVVRLPKLGYISILLNK